MAPLSPGRFAAIRLKPGDDLLTGLRSLQRQTGARAMALVTCVGSLTRVLIRHANCPDPSEYRGHYEITSLVGTIDAIGEHVHLTISDGQGRCFGGHLLPGSSVYTTAEIVVSVLEGLEFIREPCMASGYDELIVNAYPALPDDTGQSADEATDP